MSAIRAMIESIITILNVVLNLLNTVEDEKSVLNDKIYDLEDKVRELDAQLTRLKAEQPYPTCVMVGENTRREVIDYLKANPGKKIEAIKLARLSTNMNLKDAKDFVEDLMANCKELLPY